jgi:hypothetical protein
MNIEVKEKLTLIAKRTPPGDQWILEGETTVRVGIADTLQAWFEKTGLKADFRLEPLNGKLYAITTEEVEIPKKEPKPYSIYGDYTLE